MSQKTKHPVDDPTLFVKPVSSLIQLQPYREAWNRLAGDNLFQSWAWLSTWWKHYGDSNRLHVLLVFKNDTASATESEPAPEQLIGVLPTYIESRIGKGKVVRLLGDGEVCSDHLDLLAEKSDLNRIATAVAKHLVDQSHLWDSTDFN